jgi:hypothetical protein
MLVDGESNIEKIKAVDAQIGEGVFFRGNFFQRDIAGLRDLAMISWRPVLIQ